TLESNLPVNSARNSKPLNNSIQKMESGNEKSLKDIIAVGSEDDNKGNIEKSKHSINEKSYSVRKDKYVHDDEDPAKEGGDHVRGTRNPGKRISRIFITTALILLILGMAYFYFFYPTATIEIEPVIKTAKHEITITASTDLNQIDWENSTLPLHETEVEISGQEAVQCSGVKLIGNTRADGVIKFINERQEDVPIPAGTLVRTENDIRFRTVENIVVPKLQVDYLMDVPVGMKAGQAEVGIKAVNPGSSGNVGIGRIKSMVTPIDNIYVVNPDPSMGGTDKRVSLVGDEDHQRARELLEEKLRSKLITRIYQELGGNYRIVEDEISYSDPVYEFSHKVGEETDRLTVSGSLTARGYLLKNNEIDRLVTRIFKEKLPPDLQLMSSGINIEILQLEETGESMYNILIGINGPVIPDINSDRLVKQLSGLEIIEAQSLLDNMADVENFQIKSQTAKLPNMGFAIKVVVREPEEMKVFNIIE
ncbi:MAG: baseplate J/gp47 family protein, partial [Halanaerobiales bacterium]